MTFATPMMRGVFTLTTPNNQEINQLTREAIMTAMMQLLESKTIEQISVTELTKRAGVSRMAYYRNYESMTAIFQDICNQLFYRILAEGEAFILSGNWHQFWLHLFTFLYENQAEVKLILGNEMQSYFVLNYLNAAFSEDYSEATIRYNVRGMIGLAFNVMTEWVNNQFDISPNDLADLCMNFSTQQSTDVNQILINTAKQPNLPTS